MEISLKRMKLISKALDVYILNGPLDPEETADLVSLRNDIREKVKLVQETLEI